MLTNTRLTSDYEWVVTHDPTDRLFIGHIFRTIDIHDQNCNCEGWPNGITFHNLRTPELRQVKDGRVNIMLETGLGCPAAHQLAAQALRLPPSRRASAFFALHSHLLACANCQAEDKNDAENLSD